MKTEVEIWKPVLNYEGLYEVSDLGRIKSLGNSKGKKEKILNGGSDGKGYRSFRLYKNKKAKTYKLHILVAIAFLGYVPDGTNRIVVDHKDNIKTNNRADNLQLITNRKNCSKDRKGYTSDYVGVSWDKSRNKWVATIQIDGKKKNLGRFVEELDAAKAYQDKLKSLNE